MNFDITLFLFQSRGACIFCNTWNLLILYANKEGEDEDDTKDDYGGDTDYFDEENYLEDSDDKEDAGNDDDKRKQLTIHLQLQLVHSQGRRECCNVVPK